MDRPQQMDCLLTCTLQQHASGLLQLPCCLQQGMALSLPVASSEAVQPHTKHDLCYLCTAFPQVQASPTHHPSPWLTCAWSHPQPVPLEGPSGWTLPASTAMQAASLIFLNRQTHVRLPTARQQPTSPTTCQQVLQGRTLALLACHPDAHRHIRQLLASVASTPMAFPPAAVSLRQGPRTARQLQAFASWQPCQALRLMPASTAAESPLHMQHMPAAAISQQGLPVVWHQPACARACHAQWTHWTCVPAWMSARTCRLGMCQCHTCGSLGALAQWGR